VAAVWVPMEAETSPVTVVEEAEPWSDARRHGAEEAHSLRAPLVEEPEKVAAVEAPDGASTPTRVRRSVQVVAGRAWRGWRRRSRAWRDERLRGRD
jgi:hypothetical protein